MKGIVSRSARRALSLLHALRSLLRKAKRAREKAFVFNNPMISSEASEKK